MYELQDSRRIAFTERAHAKCALIIFRILGQTSGKTARHFAGRSIIVTGRAINRAKSCIHVPRVRVHIYYIREAHMREARREDDVDPGILAEEGCFATPQEPPIKRCRGLYLTQVRNAIPPVLATATLRASEATGSGK